MDDLFAQVHESLPRRHHTVLMASYAGGFGAHRTFGASEEADAELGSLTKGLTGLLYAQALERGEVTSTTLLGDLLDLAPSDLAEAPLADVATHYSGVPRLPTITSGRRQWSRTWGMWRRGQNPYGDTTPGFLTQARDTNLDKPGVFNYSNLGYALLGHALARASARDSTAAPVDYARLLRERVTRPIGMHGAYVAEAPDDLSTVALTGTSVSGKPQAAWTGAGIAPAGGATCHRHGS
jgi:CubicO group peptidase (beta-lactamase class C family)